MEFAVIFTQMHWIPILLLSVGAVFVLVEVFVPGFGFFGISGSLSIAIGIIVRICQGLNVAQSIALILVVLGFFVVMFMIFVFSAQYGLLGRTALFENKSSLDKNYNIADKQIRKLVGKTGKAISKLSLAGKAKIRGKIYDVVSINSYIEEGAHIKVVEIKDNTIFVRKWFE